MEYYAALKKDKVAVLILKSEDLQDMLFSEKTQSAK